MKSQLRTELIKLKIKDCFVNGVEIQGSIAIDLGTKKNLKFFFSMNKDQLLNVRSPMGLITENRFFLFKENETWLNRKQNQITENLFFFF